MPLDFVRYTPEIETIDPDLDRLLEQIIAFWEKTVRESPVVEDSGRAVRGAHAKTYATPTSRSSLVSYESAFRREPQK